VTKHAASTENVEHGIEGKRSVVKPFPSSGVTEKLKGLGGVPVAEANPLENLIDQFIGEENTACFEGLFQLLRRGGAAQYAEHFPHVIVFIGA